MKKFFIFCPAGRGNVNHRTMISIFGIQKELSKMGYTDVDLAILQGADVIEARNIGTSIALDEHHSNMANGGEGAVVIGIDDDVGVHPDVFRAMMEKDVP